MGTHSEKAEKWQNHMAAAAAFPGSAISYCQSQGISPSTFHHWRRKFKYSGEKVIRPAFVPVVVSSPRLKLPEAQWVAEVMTHLIRGLS